jgi:hypothetical protein
MTRLLPRFAVAAAFVSLFAASAWAGTVTPGINLSWTDCGTAGQATRNFACNTNAGVPQTMVASFMAPAGISGFIGLAGVVDFTSQTGLMPSWWDMATGGCRAGRVSGSVDFTSGPFTCTDPFGGQGGGGIDYQSPFDSTNFSSAATALAVNHARIRTLYAVPDIDSLPFDPAVEYYAFKITVTNQLSTGAGACAGCLSHMCIVFNSLSLSQSAPRQDFILSTPLAAASNQITFQGTDADCSAVPTKSKTWGQIKSLYR